MGLGGGGTGAPPSARRLKCGTGGTGAPPSATGVSLGGGGGTGAPPSYCNLFWRSFDVKTVAEAATSDTDTNRINVLWIVILILLKFWSVALRPDSGLGTMTRLPISEGVVAANKARPQSSNSDLRIYFFAQRCCTFGREGCVAFTVRIKFNHEHRFEETRRSSRFPR